MHDSLLEMEECKIAGMLWKLYLCVFFSLKHLATGCREDGLSPEAPVCMVWSELVPQQLLPKVYPENGYLQSFSKI